MGDLTYLIIFLVVINLAGRIFRALQKSAGQQASGTKPKARPRTKPKDPFAVLAERLEKLGEKEKQAPVKEEPLPRPYAEAAPEMAAAETPRDFARETAATREAEFEGIPRKELHEESFPWKGKRDEYRPPVRPVTPAPGPERGAPRSYRSDIIGMLQDSDGVRNAVLLGTILGPPRSRRGYRRRSPMKR